MYLLLIIYQNDTISNPVLVYYNLFKLTKTHIIANTKIITKLTFSKVVD